MGIPKIVGRRNRYCGKGLQESESSEMVL